MKMDCSAPTPFLGVAEAAECLKILGLGFKETQASA